MTPSTRRARVLFLLLIARKFSHYRTGRLGWAGPWRRITFGRPLCLSRFRGSWRRLGCRVLSGFMLQWTFWPYWWFSAGCQRRSRERLRSWIMCLGLRPGDIWLVFLSFLSSRGGERGSWSVNEKNDWANEFIELSMGHCTAMVVQEICAAKEWRDTESSTL